MDDSKYPRFLEWLALAAGGVVLLTVVGWACAFFWLLWMALVKYVYG